MVVGCRCLSVWHHTTNALQTSLERGQGKEVHSEASKQAKVLMADEYFPQVAFDTEALRRQDTAEAEVWVTAGSPPPRMWLTSATDCNWYLAVVAYLSRRCPINHIRFQHPVGTYVTHGAYV